MKLSEKLYSITKDSEWKGAKILGLSDEQIVGNAYSSIELYEHLLKTHKGRKNGLITAEAWDLLSKIAYCESQIKELEFLNKQTSGDEALASLVLKLDEAEKLYKQFDFDWEAYLRTKAEATEQGAEADSCEVEPQ